MIIRYDSPSALRAAYIAKGASRATKFSSDASWYGHETEAETLHKAEIGDTTLVAKAETMLSSLETQIETPRRQWERSPAGPWCSVPDVLAGLPTPMRRQVHRNDEMNPITIFVDTGSHANISADMLARRGTVVLALVLALTQARPVQLFQLHAGSGRDGETITTSEINTHPLDLATACYVLTSAGFTRRLVYQLAAKNNGYDGRFASSFNSWDQTTYYDRLKPRLVSDVKSCLIIGKTLATDKLLTEPIAWLNEQVRRFTQDQEDDDNG